MNFGAVLPDVKLTRFRHAYFVGIKGVGMTSLALLLQQAGLSVGGADSDETFVTDRLLEEHGIVADTFTGAIIPESTNVVVYSGAHQGKANPLVKEALKRKIPVLSHAQALGILSALKPTIAVAGVGGKSTTSALVSWMLELAGDRPSFSIGVGDVPNLGSSGRWAKDSRFFVVEADEYVADPKHDVTPRFLYLRPKHAIITALSFDHPDVYQSFDDTKQAFKTFLGALSEESWLVYNGDMPALRELVSAHPGVFRRLSVGEHKHNDIRLEAFSVQDGVGAVELSAPGSVLDKLTIKSRIPGKHNLLNAVYAAAMAAQLGAGPEIIARAVASFRSTKRRFEYIGQTLGGCLCYDDYAHHPREIEAVGQALKDWFPGKKLAVAFEPHTYSRTKALYEGFVSSLAALDAEVLLLPIFASARESFDPSVTSQMLVDDLQKRGCSVRFCPDQSALLEYVQALGEDTVCITLGAGTIYKVYEHVDFLSTPEPLS